MDYEIKVPDSKKFIHLVVKADMTSSLGAKMINEAGNLGVKNNTDRLLMDPRDSKNFQDVRTNYYYVKELPNLEVQQFKKVAHVSSFHDNSHGSVVAFLLHKGYDVKVFFSEKKAVEWLER